MLWRWFLTLGDTSGAPAQRLEQAKKITAARAMTLDLAGTDHVVDSNQPQVHVEEKSRTPRWIGWERAGCSPSEGLPSGGDWGRLFLSSRNSYVHLVGSSYFRFPGERAGGEANLQELWSHSLVPIFLKARYARRTRFFVALCAIYLNLVALRPTRDPSGEIG